MARKLDRKAFQFASTHYESLTMIKKSTKCPFALQGNVNKRKQGQGINYMKTKRRTRFLVVLAHLQHLEQFFQADTVMEEISSASAV